MSYLDRFRLTGRTALVTGAAQGIGYACAEALAEAGARVVMTDRDGDAAVGCGRAASRPRRTGWT
jgi:NAD(P)-dependent dehydrogenase (short-subunit alcohol dehydrogenase family)